MMGAFLMGCDTIQKRNLRRDSIGDSISHTGKKIGSKTSIPIKRDPHLRLRQILGLRMPLSSSGFANTTSLVEPVVRLVKSRNGGVSEKKIRCMEGAGIRVQDGKAVAPRNDNLFIRPLNGPQLFLKYGNAIIINAKGAEHHTTECTFTISNPSQSKQNVQTPIISSSYVQNATGLSIVNAMLRGC